MDPFLLGTLNELRRQEMLDAAAQIRTTRRLAGYRSLRQRLGVVLISLGEHLGGRPVEEPVPAPQVERGEPGKLLAISMSAGKVSGHHS